MRFTQLRQSYRFSFAGAVLLTIFVLGWFGALEYRGLFIPDEARYAEIPREMLATGDWTTPRLNDLKYFEKPPFQYWLTAVSFALFGEDEWTARLPGAILGFLAVLIVGLTACRIWDSRAGVVASTVLGSSWAFYLSGQYLTLDMTLSAFLTVALCAFLLAQRDEATAGETQRWMMVAWAAAACAMLSKGLVAVTIPGLALCLYSILGRDYRVWGRLNMCKGFLIFAVIALPWFVLVQIRNPEFFEFFFFREHIQRFTEASHGRPGAWWYYIPILIVGFMPWTPLLVMRARHLAITRPPTVPARVTRFNNTWFCLAWAVSILGFFSISHSKLPGYIIPALPALALWVCHLPSDLHVTALKVCAWSAIAFGALLWFGVTYLPAWQKFQVIGPDAVGAIPILFIATAILSASGVCAILAVAKRKPLWAMICLAAGTFAFFGGIFGFLHRTDAHFSSERLIEDLTNDTKPFQVHAPMFSVGQFDHSLPFYLGRPLTLVATRGELAPGIDAEPHKAIASITQFKKIWIDMSGQAFAVMSPAQYQDFLGVSLPMVKLAEDRRLIVVSRR